MGGLDTGQEQLDKLRGMTEVAEIQRTESSGKVIKLGKGIIWRKIWKKEDNVG